MEVFKDIPAELDEFAGDLMIAVVGEDERPLRATNAWIDWRLYGTLSQLIVRGTFWGKLGEKCMVPTYTKFNFDRLVLVGGGELFDGLVGPIETDGQERWHKISSVIEETIAHLKVSSVGISLPRYESSEQEKALVRTLENTHLPSGTSLFLSRASRHSTRSASLAV